MIIEYQRPVNEAEAIELLNRPTPKTLPLGGGTMLSKTKEEIAVVDLQSLGWNKIEIKEEKTLAGSSVTLEELLSYFGTDSVMGKAIAIDAGKNIRDMATIGGALSANDGRSALLTVLLACNIELVFTPGDTILGIDQWLVQRANPTTMKLISQIRLPNVEALDFESVGRSPLDKPILCCAVAKFAHGRTRIVFGGFGDRPVLAYDGGQSVDIAGDVEKALRDSGDQWASAQYRQEIGNALTKRLVSRMA